MLRFSFTYMLYTNKYVNFNFVSYFCVFFFYIKQPRCHYELDCK